MRPPRTDTAEDAVAAVVVACVGMLVLAIGGVHPELHIAAVVVAGAGLVTLALMRRPRSLPVTLAPLPFAAGALASFALLVPLPRSLLRLLAPEVAWRIEEAAAILPADLSPASVLALDPPETALSAARLTAAALVALIVAIRARRARSRRTLGLVVVGVAAVVAVVAIGHTALGVDGPWSTFFRYPPPVFAPLVNPNHNGKVLGALGIFALGQALALRRSRTRRVSFAVAVVALLLVPCTWSKGAVLATLIAGALLAMSSWTGRRQLVVVVAALCAVAAFFAAAAVGLVPMGKAFLWSPALSVTERFFPWGTGPGGFPMALSAEMAPGLELKQTYSHVENLALDELAGRGLAGLVIALIAMVCAVRWWRAPSARAPLAALSVFVVGDLADFSLELPGPLLLGAVFAGLASAGGAAGRGASDPGAGGPGSAPSGSGRRASWLAVIAVTVLAVTAAVAVAWPTRASWRLRQDSAVVDGAARTAHLQRALQAHPADAQLAYELAVDARLRRDRRAALRAANLALLLAPAQPGAHLEAARALAAVDRVRQALLEYRLAFLAQPSPRLVREIATRTDDVDARLSAVPPTADALLWTADVLVADGRLDEAQEVLDEAADAADANPRLAARSVRLALQRDDVDGAVFRLGRLVGDPPWDDVEAVVAADVWRRAVGVEATLTEIATWPSSLALLTWRFDAALAADAVDEALATLDRLQPLARDPRQRVRLLQSRLRLARRTGDRAMALRAATDIVREQPRDAGAWIARATVEIELGLVDEARLSVARLKAMKVDPARVEALEALLTRGSRADRPDGR